MSTQNIISITPTDGGVIVTFETHTQGVISYFYSDSNGAAQIADGADPALYEGQRVS